MQCRRREDKFSFGICYMMNRKGIFKEEVDTYVCTTATALVDGNHKQCLSMKCEGKQKLALREMGINRHCSSEFSN